MNRRTGKTTAMIEEAKRLADLGEKVLVVFYHAEQLRLISHINVKTITLSELKSAGLLRLIYSVHPGDPVIVRMGGNYTILLIDHYIYEIYANKPSALD